MTFDPSRAFAEQQDESDPLQALRGEFLIPKRADGEDEVYLCGNSLGLQPRRTRACVLEVLDDWQQLAVRAHFDAKHAWLPYHEYLTAPLGRLVGALPEEVVAMNSLTVNLHLLMVSFYRPTSERFKILIEEHAFPSDRYAVASQLAFHGIEAETGLALLRPRAGEACLRTEDILERIEREGSSLALVLLPGVQYRTGEVLDMAAISRAALQVGALVGLDLAHAAGNVELSLHDWSVDFAAWCSYKYLNSGPGSVAGAFVHAKHVGRTDLKRFAGWWGHDKATRFRMGPSFEQIRTAEGWQLSNPPILSLAAVRAALDTFDAAGGMGPLAAKSRKLTGYFRRLLEHELPRSVEILTPSEAERQGCQLSLTVRLGDRTGRDVQQRLEADGVVVDFREPNVLRAAPTPLYNRFTDCHDFVTALKGVLQA